VVLAALSPVFVQLVLPITVSCASETYLLLVESAISAVVASDHHVTNHLASYVILVLVAHVIAQLAVTLLARFAQPSLISFQVAQSNTATLRSVAELGQDTSQPQAHAIAALTAFSVGILVSTQGLPNVVTTHNQSFNTLPVVSENCGIWLAVLDQGQVTSQVQAPAVASS
jgi:hypothetical protein